MHISVVAALATVLLASSAQADYFSNEDLEVKDNLIFTDRSGEMLRFLPDANGLRHLRVRADEVPDHVKKAFVAIEDERFYSHSGVDMRAVLRALKDNLFHGSVVSGASTITQQTARLIHPHPRTLGGKLIEMFMSGELEKKLTKDAILEQYLNRVPLGPGIAGIGLAARIYFDRKPADLSIAQAALLAALPKAPGYYNPYGINRDKLLERKNIVLSKMLSLSFISKEQYDTAKAEELLFKPRAGSPNFAPHVIELLKARTKPEFGIHKTTLDLSLQQDIEKVLQSHKRGLVAKGAHQAAVMVVRNSTMEVLASVGSIAYSETDGGFNNGTTVRRSAGSTLKPFLYAAAIENGYTASSLLEDVIRQYKTPYGFYSPDNFDQHQYGPVTMRTALGNSLNISSVKLLEAIRVEEGYDLMRQLRLMPDDGRDGADYGLGLAIGNAEVTLEGLANAYAVLANRGRYRPLRYLIDSPREDAEPVFSEQAAYIVTDILSDPSSRLITFGRALSFPFKLAVKTGTSTSYRDGWAVGYTPDYTIGVWVGNFEGDPTDHMSGAAGAVPIFKEVIRLLYGDTPPASFTQPEGLVSIEVCGISGMLPGPKCTHRVRELFIAGTEPRETCSFHRHEEYYHELPAAYAGWLYERERLNAAGSFRLAGFPSELEAVFHQPQDPEVPIFNAPSIRVRYPALKGTHEGSITPKLEYDNIYSAGSQASTVRIVYPLPDDRFVIYNAAESAIKLESVVTAPVPYVDWFIDGMHIGRTGPPYQLVWELQRGRHNIMAVGPDRRGDSISVTVE
ncbi:MAG TPA: penicillin-binding protein 1C [Dissulfurispiraceae bacterium]|nr:penicillin-binding protein 1C [Dissulfurispiraceae bacterium]